MTAIFTSDSEDFFRRMPLVVIFVTNLCVSITQAASHFAFVWLRARALARFGKCDSFNRSPSIYPFYF